MHTVTVKPHTAKRRRERGGERGAGSGDGGGELATEIEPDWPSGRLRC